MTMRVSPPAIVAAGGGLARNFPPGWRIASTRVPVRSWTWALRSVWPASGEGGQHLHLVQAELQAPVVHDHVEEVGHVRLEGQGRHPGPARVLRVDHPVGAGLDQLGHRRPAGGPRHDEQARRHRPRGQGDIQVVGVGVQRGD
jgi:hypothetical protein